MKKYIKIVMGIILASLTASASSELEEVAPPSLADHLHMKRSTDPVDGGWLPNLTGLPDRGRVAELTNNVIQQIWDEKDAKCNSVDLRLRMLVFQHFMIHQEIANAQNHYFDEQTAYKWAHILAMILKESSGDSTNVTGMSGRSVTTNKPITDLTNWKDMLVKAEQSRIHLNYQTNFGLTQTSTDRLFVAFHLAKDQAFNTEYLEGKEGASTPRKIALNTAIAIRRLIWFYQDFAQGRITQSDTRIWPGDLNKPEFFDRYKIGLNRALLYCGTGFMFNANYPNTKEEQAKLQEAMASIAYCKLGNSHSGYGKNEIDEKCFAEWVTLCPALNIDIAHLTPLSYFATRGEKPVCEGTFKRMINPKPASQ